MITIGKNTKDSPLQKDEKYHDGLVNVLQGYRNARDYYVRKMSREVENWRMYWAHDADLGLGQWPAKAVEYMTSQNRQMLTYNFIKPAVDTIAGGIMQVPFDPEFFPVNDEMTSLTRAIKKAMYSDKELMDWSSVYLQLVTGGLIHESVIKMVVSNEYDDLGNIGFKYCLPGSTLASPYWKDWGSKTCKKCWHESWHTPEDLLEIYPEKSYEIKAAMNMRKSDPDEYGVYNGVTPFYQEYDDGMWGSLHRVIEEYTVTEEITKVEIALTENGKVEIPRNLENTDKPQWLNEFHPTWRPDYVFEEDRTNKVCKVKAIVPTLTKSDIMEDGKTEIQIGRTPFFFWSASRANGESHSIVDSIKDVQTNINYHESLLTYKIQTEGGGGSQFVDRSGFVDDNEYKNYIKNRNDPTANFEVRPGLIADDGREPARPTRNSAFPNEVYSHLDHIINTVLPHISKVTPAQRGMQGGAQESGKLFELLKIQSDQQLYTIHYGLRIFWNEVYEAYFLQASETYSNEGLPRKFSCCEGSDSITLNEVVDLPDGRKAIKNDASQLKNIRHKIIISEKQQSPMQKLEELDAIGRFIGKIPPEKQASIQVLSMEAMKRMDSLGEEVIETLTEVGNKELGILVKGMEIQDLQLEIEKKKLEKQLKQLDEMEKQAAEGDVSPEATLPPVDGGAEVPPMETAPAPDLANDQSPAPAEPQVLESGFQTDAVPQEPAE